MSQKIGWQLSSGSMNTGARWTSFPRILAAVAASTSGTSKAMLELSIGFHDTFSDGANGLPDLKLDDAYKPCPLRGLGRNRFASGGPT